MADIVVPSVAEIFLSEHSTEHSSSLICLDLCYSLRAKNGENYVLFVSFLVFENCI